MNDIEKCPKPIDLIEFPGQGTCQVEAEPVDMHVRNPVSEAIHDELE